MRFFMFKMKALVWLMVIVSVVLFVAVCVQAWQGNV